MTSATVDSKGRVTIPSNVRLAMGLSTGDRIEFVDLGHGRIEVVASTLSVTAIKGVIAKPTTPVAVQDMHDACRVGRLSRRRP